MRWLLILAWTQLVFTHSLAAQELYPPPGNWPGHMDGRVIGGNIVGLPFIYNRGDQDELRVKVGQCSELITLEHPEAIIRLDLVNEAYSGTTSFDGATATMTLTPNNQASLSGIFDIRFPPHQITWSVDLTIDLSAAQGPSAGQGEVSTTINDEEEVGVFTIENTEYSVELRNFDINSSELLPNHISALESAVNIIRGNSEYDSCESIYSLKNFSTIHGYASQTGPETVNERLALSRAEEISRYLVQSLGKDFFLVENSRLFGLGEPNTTGNPATPPVYAEGAELTCNRSAEFSFVIERSFVDMYSSEEAQSWLRTRLSAVSVLPENEREFAIRDAKANYVMAENYRDMIREGFCNPPVGSPAYIALKSDNDLQAASESAYRAANNEEENPYFSGSLASNDVKRVNAERARADPYYRYTYSSNDAARSTADTIEREMTGENVDWGFD